MHQFEQSVYVVILAGGSGTRFWPRSRHESPKQLCVIGQEKETMIEATISRLDDWIPEERRIVVTHVNQIAKTKELVGSRVAKIIAEPDSRNTANALALAAIEIKHTSSLPNPVMISLHADSLVQNVATFQKDLETAVSVARNGYLTLLGVVPQYPETGYGYIEAGKPLQYDGATEQVYTVASFREKPDFALAKEFFEAGSFMWNTGIFVWPIDLIIEELNQYLPGVVSKLEGLLTKEAKKSFTEVDPLSFAAVYEQLPRVAIDNAVLEVSRRVAVIKTEFGWHDIGSWGSLDKCFPTDNEGNLKFGQGVLVDCHGVTIDSEGPFIAGIGLKDLVIVAAKGAILVCPKDRAQDVKKLVEWLHENGRSDLT